MPRSDSTARRLHGGPLSRVPSQSRGRRRRPSDSRGDSREPKRRRASPSPRRPTPRRSASPRQDRRLPNSSPSRPELPRASGHQSPVNTNETTWFFELPGAADYSAERAKENLMNWVAAHDIHQASCPQITKVVERLVSLGVTSPGRLLGFTTEELSQLFAQPTGLHQEINVDILHSILARRLMALAWQSQHGQVAAKHAATGVQQSDFAVEQLRVNSQLAAALERIAKGPTRASRSSILREHESDDEDVEKFDLASALSKASHSFLPTDWFPSTQLLARLQKLLIKARDVRKHQDHPFIADSSLESWVPLWVGHGESPVAREAQVKQWRKTENLDTPKFLSLVSNFWLAHAVVGVVQFQDVFAHLLLLIRMNAEHGLVYAIRYERELHYELQSLTRGSEKFSFSELLNRPLRRLTHKLDIKHYRVRKADESEKVANVPDPRKPRLDKGKTGDVREPATSQPGRMPICFRHDPAQGLTCPERSTCRMLHLDTTDPRSAERYAAALKSFKTRRGKAADRS